MFRPGQAVIANKLYKCTVVAYDAVYGVYELISNYGSQMFVEEKYIEETIQTHVQPLDNVEVESHTLIPIEQYVIFKNIKDTF